MRSMPALQPGNLSLLDRSNGRHTVSSTSTPPYGSSPAKLKLVGGEDLQHRALDPAGWDEFSYYNDYMNNNTFPVDDADGYAEYDNGYTDVSAIGSAAHVGSQMADRPGGIPCNLTARLPNRSNGMPLATIIEHCSGSTLNSRGSLASVGYALPYACSVNALSGRESQSSVQDRGNTVLQRPPKDVQSRKGLVTPINRSLCREVDRGLRTFDIHSQIRSSNAISPAYSPEPQTGDAEDSTRGKRRSMFFRDVFHTVQATSRARSGASSLDPQATTVSTKDKWAGSTHGSPRSHQYGIVTSCDNAGTQSPGAGSTLSPTSTAADSSQTGNREIPSTENLEPSARAHPPLLAAEPYESEFTVEASPAPYLLLPSVVTRSRGQFAYVHPVPPKPRDGAQNDTMAGVTRLPCESRNATSVQYMFESAPVCPKNASSLAEYDHARESSRNASFCSTMSTSYSGTVLGVDLDLHTQLADGQTLCRSRSPTPIAAPEWFTPQMAELERQASSSESPEVKQRARLTPITHSMRSSALTSLLPIAATSGIVTPNYNTPKISFYSPSGNLIQPESSSSLGTSPSGFTGSPAVTTSFYNIRQPTRKTLPVATCLPPVRPALLPKTTPPILSAPLPANVRHHHNYRRREKSQIEPTEPFTILATVASKGCGGIVKSPSFTPRSGAWHEHGKAEPRSYHEHRRSTRTIFHDLVFEANFFKAGVITAASTSCIPIRRGRSTRRRHVTEGRSAADACMQGKIVSGPTSASVVEDENVRMTSTLHEHDEDSALGALVGHALRICFCQPYDGVGKPTHAIAAGTSCVKGAKVGMSLGLDQAKRASQTVQEVDGEVPNARVIEKKKKGSNSQNKKRSAVGEVRDRIKTTSDNMVGMRAGLRVATVGT